MRASSIFTSKYFHTSYGIYIKWLYPSEKALVLILYERVRFPPQNAPNLALKLPNKGTFRVKNGCAQLKFCISCVCTNHMRCIKDVCIIQNMPWFWYSKNESAVHSRTPNNPCLKPLNGGTFGCKNGWGPLKFWLPSVCTHYMGHINGVHDSSTG